MTEGPVEPSHPAVVQRILTSIEVIGLIVLAVAGLINASHHAAHPFTWNWFSLGGYGNRVVLLVIFVMNLFSLPFQATAIGLGLILVGIIPLLVAKFSYRSPYFEGHIFEPDT